MSSIFFMLKRNTFNRLNKLFLGLDNVNLLFNLIYSVFELQLHVILAK
jgi:hypothetical protein